MGRGVSGLLLKAADTQWRGCEDTTISPPFPQQKGRGCSLSCPFVNAPDVPEMLEEVKFSDLC